MKNCSRTSALELGQASCAWLHLPAHPAQRFEAALVDHAARHAGIEQRADPHSLRPPLPISAFSSAMRVFRRLRWSVGHFRYAATDQRADRCRPRPAAPAIRRSRGRAISLRASCVSRHLSSTLTMLLRDGFLYLENGLSAAAGFCARELPRPPPPPPSLPAYRGRKSFISQP